MRNRSFLPLMEMLFMIGVFAIASVICLQVFSAANAISKKRSELDSAVLLAQDTCEMLKYSKGNMEYAAELTGGKITDGCIVIYCNNNDPRIPGNTESDFIIKITDRDSNGLFGQANVSVSTTERTVYSVTVAWQE